MIFHTKRNGYESDGNHSCKTSDVLLYQEFGQHGWTGFSNASQPDIHIGTCFIQRAQVFICAMWYNDTKLHLTSVNAVQRKFSRFCLNILPQRYICSRRTCLIVSSGTINTYLMLLFLSLHSASHKLQTCRTCNTPCAVSVRRRFPRIAHGILCTRRSSTRLMDGENQQGNCSSPKWLVRRSPAKTVIAWLGSSSSSTNPSRIL